MTFMDIRGAVNGTTGYVEGTLVGKDVTISLPEVAAALGEVQAMGTMEIPIIGILDAMEASIKRIGVDMGLAKCCAPESKTYEFRWVQQVTKSDGTTSVEGCKAFIRGVPKIIIPGMDIEPGATVETEIPLAVSRYQLFVGGKEVLCVDRLSQILRVDGKDYYSNVNSLL